MAFTPKIARKRWVSAVTETTKGTDPNTGYNTMLLNVGVSNDSTANFIERDVLSADFGTFGGVTTSKVWDFKAQAEVKGGGAVSPVPEVDPLLQACAAKYEAGKVLVVPSITGTFTVGETVTQGTTAISGVVLATTATNIFLRDVAGTFTDAALVTGGTSSATATPSSVVTSALYTPTSDYAVMQTASIRDYPDGIIKQVTGAMGTATIAMESDGLPTLDFTITGIYAAPVDSAATAGTVSDVDPQPFNGATLKLGAMPAGCTGALKSLNFDMGNTVSQIKCAEAGDGITAIMITDAKPTVSINVTRPDLSDFNPFALRDADDTFEVLTIYGTGAGERVALGVPNAQITGLTESDSDGLDEYSIEAACTKDGVNPKWFLAFY
jgi:hypothetical protein